MGRIDALAQAYDRHISVPWLPHLSGAQKQIFVVYDKEDERRLRARRQLFEIATKNAGHSWHEIDLTPLFPEWMAKDEYREAYFESPQDLELKLDTDLVSYARERLLPTLTHPSVNESGVVALFGAGALFGIIRLSSVLKAIEGDIRGRLVVFFPGHYEDGHYRLLDARDGWSYLAVPITVHSGEARP